jgi:hypothetical protein
MIKKIIQYSAIIVHTVLVLTISAVTCPAANDTQKIIALTPATASNKVSANSVQEEDKVYIKRRGEVSFAADTFLPKSSVTGKRAAAEASFKGRALSVSFFPEQTFNIDVSHDTRPKKEMLSVNGKGRSKKLSTFSMTVTEDNYIMNYQDLDTATLYRVIGNTQTGLGIVTEIDLEKLPASYDLPARIPPEHSGSE